MKAKRLNKQYLRDKMAKVASYIEIYLAAIIVVGLLVASLTVIHELRDMTVFVMGGKEVNFQSFLTHAIELIIGIEFVKMLAKHTPGSAMDVLLFAIARKLIVHDVTMIDSLIGVVAIALLFAVKKYLTSLDTHPNQEEFIFNGGTSLKEADKIAGVKLPHDLGNTLAGVVCNIANKEADHIIPGYEVTIQDTLMQVYSMDGGLIKQVMVKKVS